MSDSNLSQLIDAIRAQTEAMDRLVHSNAALIQAMAEGEGMDEDQEPETYLDGGTLD